MIARGALLRWTSPQKPARHGAEWNSVADGNAGRSLAHLVDELDNASFLIVRLDLIDPRTLAPAIEAYHEAGGSARLCLAGDRATLVSIEAASIDSDDVGLLLDDVDADTPLSDLIWDRIEAVRFDADFVTRAARNLRLGCALESMLALAKDIGLCTLGADAMPGGGALAGRADFDYLPSPRDRAASARAPMTRETAISVGR